METAPLHVACSCADHAGRGGTAEPHLPFVASQEQFDQYPLESIQLPQHPVAPQGMPDAAWVDTGDSASPWTPMDQNDTLHARRAYYAAVTHTDTKVGEILSALEEKGLANSTIILFHADHGCVQQPRDAATYHVPTLTHDARYLARIPQLVAGRALRVEEVHQVSGHASARTAKQAP